MNKIEITDKRLKLIRLALGRSFFKIVNNKQEEIQDWEYDTFIMAMFSGNPGVNLNGLEDRIRKFQAIVKKILNKSSKDSEEGK